MTRKEKAELHHSLIELITNCENDAEMYARLVYALEIITSELSKFAENA